jgi:hypothetical protein
MAMLIIVSSAHPFSDTKERYADACNQNVRPWIFATRNVALIPG